MMNYVSGSKDSKPNIVFSHDTQLVHVFTYEGNMMYVHAGVPLIPQQVEMDFP